MSKYNDLLDNALFVRSILDKCKSDNDSFSDFPNGYCSEASLWLYDYLQYKGFRNLEFRMKDPFLDNYGNHVWLHCEGYDIDLTADQFNSNPLYDFLPVCESWSE